ncbi:MAG: TRAM domain-containing protein [Nanoarchaeota archaeon]
MNGEREPPVRVGETHEVSIDAVGGKGDGIAKVKGFVVFVPGVKKGDFVKIRITKVLQNVGFAEVLGEAERPVQEQRYATVSRSELQQNEEPESRYEDTEDFGDS